MPHGSRSRRRLPRLAPTIATVAALLGGAATTVVLVQNADAGVAPPAGAIRAASYLAQSGAALESTSEGGVGQNVGWLADGDWMRYDDVDLGATISLRFAAAYPDRPGTVEVRSDSLTGKLLATVPISDTGGWQDWRTATATAVPPSQDGAHNVFLVIRSAQPHDFVNLAWFSFTSDTPGPSPSVTPSSTSPSASTGTPSPAVASPPATGWIPVDQDRWAAQLAAFRALTPRPAPANPRRNSEFNATCTYSHSVPDDPIVFPGMAGASHLHSFLGNKSTDANSTTESLMRFTASSCRPAEDHSAYWVPTLLEHGKPVEPKQVIVYYGSELDDKTKTVPVPYGLRMISGDAKRQVPTPAGSVNAFHCSTGPLEGKARSKDGNWPVCDGGSMNFILKFPDCWDGKHLDSPNHKSHVAFGENGKCTAAFPVPIPALKFTMAYPTTGSEDGFALASGMASSMHGDAFFAWEDEAMASRVKNCVVQTLQCDTEGRF